MQDYWNDGRGKNGMLEEWNIGTREEWKDGGTEGWKDGDEAPIIPPFQYSSIPVFRCHLHEFSPE